MALLAGSFVFLPEGLKSAATTKDVSASDVAPEASTAQAKALDKIKDIEQANERADKKKQDSLSNWGTANLEKVRNMTTSYTDIFFEEDEKNLGSKLPNNTVIQIATLRTDIKPLTQVQASSNSKNAAEIFADVEKKNAWQQLDPQVQTNLNILIAWLKEKGALAGIISGAGLSDATEALSRTSDFDTKFANKFSGKKEDFAAILKSQAKNLFESLSENSKFEVSPYRFFAARKIMGAWRLIADTNDASDPATQFIVEHYRDGQLNDWLGFRPVVQDNFYLAAVGGNAVTSSADKFAGDEFKSAHWKLDGTNLNNCALVSRDVLGFLSCRDLSDEKLLQRFAFDPKADLDFTSYKTKLPGKQFLVEIKEEKIIPEDFFISRDRPVDQELMNKISIVSKYFYTYKNMRIKKYFVSVGINNDDTPADTKRDVTIRDPQARPYSIHHMMLLMAKCLQFAKTASDAEKNNLKAVLDRISVQAKVEFENAVKDNKSQRRNINYGDKVKLVSAQSLKNLYGRTGKHSEFKGAGEQNQGIVICATDFAPGFADELGLEDSESWWTIKGPHKKGDAFNAEIGSPVKNGDVIRLENAKSQKNLHCTKTELKDLGVNFRKSSAVTLFGNGGDGDSFDNWVISFHESEGQELFVGQQFELKSQNIGTKLLTSADKQYFMQGTSGKKTDFTVAEEKSNVGSVWAIDSYQKGALPVENVAWTGVPFGAASTDRGPKEDLKINIVKLGMGGGIAPNNTLEIKVNVQDKQPMVTGFAKEIIPEFAPGFLVNLSPLFDQGLAWVSESFENEGNASASFLVRAADSGNAQIILGNNMTLDYTYKFILGANENTETQLVRRDFDSSGRPFDTIVAKITKEQNPLAAIRSGVFAPYWISVKDGTLMLGVGEDLGENVLIVWRDPSPRNQVSRLGFGSDREPVEFTNVKIGAAFQISPPDLKYAEAKAETPISDGQIFVSNFAEFQGQKVGVNDKFPAGIKLRVPGRGALCFDVKNSGEFSVALLSPGITSATDGQVRYVVKLYGENTNQDFDRRAKFYVATLNTLVRLFEEKFTATGYSKEAIEQIRSSIKDTFNTLQPEAIGHLMSSIKDFLRNFEDWKTLQAGFNDVKNRFTDVGLITTTEVDTAILKNSAGVDDATLAGGDVLKKIFVKLFEKLRTSLGVGSSTKRDDIGSSAPKTAKDAVLRVFENIFANRYFDLEARPICTLHKFDQKTGKLDLVARVLESDVAATDSFAKIKADSYRKYWMNFSQGRIFVGTGEFGENLFFYNWDKAPNDDFVEIALTSKGAASIKDFAVAPELAITRADKMAAYKQESQLFDFKGKLQVISPYKYRLSQEGPSVKFKDELSGKTYYPGKVPQKGALYYFMLVIREDGFPELVWSREPENPEKLALEKSASIMKATSDTLMQASTYVQGMGVLGGLIGVGASVAYSAAGVALGVEAGKKDTSVNLDYKSHDSYVYTDSAKIGQLVGASVPPEAVTNQAAFQKDLGVGGNWIGDATKLSMLIPHFRKVLSKITHPFVVSNQADKTLLFSHINSLFNTHRKTYLAPESPLDNTFSDMIKFLMAAYNNRYLVDRNSKSEQKTRNDWYAKANDLARDILKRDPEHEVNLEPMYGEYVWLNETFQTTGEGSISFEAVGQNDAMIAFAAEPVQVRNSTKQIYEVVVGSWDNSKTVIRTQSLGKTVAETTHPEMRCKIVKSTTDPLATKYWISINNGKIILGRGDLDPKGAIGILDSKTGQILDVKWTEPIFAINPKIKALAEIEKELIKLSSSAVLSSVAKLLSVDPLDVNNYLVFLEQQKPLLLGDDYKETLALVSTPPADPAPGAVATKKELYEDHLGKIFEKLQSERQKVLERDLSSVVDKFKALDFLKSKEFDKLLSALPATADKYAAYAVSVAAQLQANLPSILDANPVSEYKIKGSYDVGKAPFFWQDPYPIRDIKYIGISSWDAPIEYSKITVGPKIEDVGLYKVNLLAKLRAIRGEKLSQIVG